MTDSKTDSDIVAQVVQIRTDLPQWVKRAVDLVELAENTERAAVRPNPETLDQSRKLIVEIAVWQQKLSDWQERKLSPELRSELRILKATLDAAMDEANAAARQLGLLD